MSGATSKIRHLRYEKLRKRLSEIPYWPHRYRHKIIGKNEQLFIESLQSFEKQFPELSQTGMSESSKGTYISVTYELVAEDVDQIIALWVASEEVEGVMKVL